MCLPKLSYHDTFFPEQDMSKSTFHTPPRFPAGVVPPTPRFWWTPPEPKTGHINGLDAFAGTVFATNGVFVALRTATGGILFGHKDHFIPNKEEKETSTSPTRRGRKANVFVVF